MPIYRITTKSRKIANGIRIEPGMEVQVVTNSFSNPLTYNGGAEVDAAFQRVWGISPKRAGILSSAWLDVEKIG